LAAKLFAVKGIPELLKTLGFLETDGMFTLYGNNVSPVLKL